MDRHVIAWALAGAALAAVLSPGTAEAFVTVPDDILTLNPAAGHIIAPKCIVDEIAPSVTALDASSGQALTATFGTAPQFEGNQITITARTDFTYTIDNDGTRVVFGLASSTNDSNKVASFVAGEDRDGSGNLGSASVTWGQWDSVDHDGLDMDLGISLQHRARQVAIEGTNGGGLYSPSPTGIPLYWYDKESLYDEDQDAYVPVQLWLPGVVQTTSVSGALNSMAFVEEDGVYVPTGEIYAGTGRAEHSAISGSNPPRDIQTESSTDVDGIALSGDVWCHYAQAVAAPATDAPPLVAANGEAIISGTDNLGEYEGGSTGMSLIDYADYTIAVSAGTYQGNYPLASIGARDIVLRPEITPLASIDGARDIVLRPEITPPSGFDIDEMRLDWQYELNTSSIVTPPGSSSLTRDNGTLRIFKEYLHMLDPPYPDMMTPDTEASTLTAVLNVTHPGQTPGSRLWEAATYTVLLGTCETSFEPATTFEFPTGVDSGSTASATSASRAGTIENTGDLGFTGLELAAGDWYVGDHGLLRAVGPNATEYMLDSSGTWADMGYLVDLGSDGELARGDDLDIDLRINMASSGIKALKYPGDASQAIGSMATCD